MKTQNLDQLFPSSWRSEPQSVCNVQHPEAWSVQYLRQLHEEKSLLNFVSEKLKEVREICQESERQTDRKVWGCEWKTLRNGSWEACKREMTSGAVVYWRSQVPSRCSSFKGNPASNFSNSTCLPLIPHQLASSASKQMSALLSEEKLFKNMTDKMACLAMDDATR